MSLADPSAVCEAEVELAVNQLRRSARGRSALQHLAAWFEDDALGLDERNQRAVFILLNAAWGPLASTTWNAIQQLTTEQEPNHVGTN